MFVITHKCGTNDPDTRPSFSQSCDLDSLVAKCCALAGIEYNN